MATSAKIRVLLALLCASLFFTAVIVQKTYTPVKNLYQTAQTLEDNLHKKEISVNNFLDEPGNFNLLKTFPDNYPEAFKQMQDFTTDRNIWFITLQNNRLKFWSGIKVIPEHPELIKEGNSFYKSTNGYYEVIRKTKGNFSAIFFLEVKINYAFQNQYLQNSFATELTKDKNIEIADFTDKGVYGIHSINKTYLFSVKLNQGEINLSFFYFELTIWLLTLFCLCVLVQNTCNYFIIKGYTGVAFLLMAVFIVGVRFLNLHYGWPDFTYRLQIFNPSLYASSTIYPSLGDLSINLLFISWFVVYVYTKRGYLNIKPKKKTTSYFILAAGTIVLVLISATLLNLFYGLVINSKISFDVSNVLNLSSFSLLGVLMLCFSFLVFYLLNEVFLSVAIKLPVDDTYKLIIFLSGILIATILSVGYQGFTLFYLLWSIIVLIRAYYYRYLGAKLDLGSFATIIFICAVISSIKLNYFESVKEDQTRKAYIQKLEVPDDVNADVIFKKIEHQIIADSAIIHYFNSTTRNNDYVKNRLQKLYLNGYLSKYDFNAHEFNDKSQSLSNDKNYALSDFKDLVLYSSYKVSDYFYRENQSFGYQNYFAILPIMVNDKNLGTIVVELKSRPLQSFSSFPALLIDGEENFDDEFKGYSYAYYLDGKLLSQRGSYVYNLVNNNLQGKLKTYISKTTGGVNTKWYLNYLKYKHLIYQPSARTLIVVTKDQNLLFFTVTSVTFFFVIFLAFGVVILLSRWVWLRIRILNISNDRIKWNFKINTDLILYKTRIQFSMVFAVVITLVVVGFITFYSISTQFQTQQDKTIRDKITRIASAFQVGNYDKYLNNANESGQVDFNNFANSYSTDLTLFDLNGNELITTQPKIYEYGLLSRHMNAKAFLNLSRMQQSEYISEGKIGLLTYKSAFIPLRNTHNETIAYLQLPYFSNEADYSERIGSLLNIMINVYALVFIGIGLFAVIIARQITAPLSFIQFSLSKTMYGKKK